MFAKSVIDPLMRFDKNIISVSSLQIARSGEGGSILYFFPVIKNDKFM